MFEFMYATKYGIITPFDINGDGLVDYKDVHIMEDLRAMEIMNAHPKVPSLPEIQIGL